MIPARSEVPYPLTDRRETVGELAFDLRCLTSFEEAAPVVQRHHARHRTTAELVDLSPMFGAVWGATRAVAERVHALGASLRTRRVLELGCGLALPSMVAARHGAVVLATDHHPDAGAFLARNLARNHLDGVRFEQVDLRAIPPALGRHDLVLASDVLFARDMPGIVAAAFAATLQPGGTGLLGDPGRSYLPEFEEEARARGLDVDVDVVRVLTPQGPDDAFLLTLTAARRG